LRDTVRAMAFDWVELRRWYNQIMISARDGWHMADVGERINCLMFAFETSEALTAFESRMKVIGVPLSSAPVFNCIGPPRPSSGDRRSLLTHQEISL
jgi:hypothetical protein